MFIRFGIEFLIINEINYAIYTYIELWINTTQPRIQCHPTCKHTHIHMCTCTHTHHTHMCTQADTPTQSYVYTGHTHMHTTTHTHTTIIK